MSIVTRYGLAIDTGRCTGCFACVVACKSENYTQPGVSWIRIDEKEHGEFPMVSRSYIPMLCMQCGDLPCAEPCPTGAIGKADGGIVLVDSGRCIGCADRPCVAACPFNVLSVNERAGSYFPEYLSPDEREGYEAHREGVVEKCTLCHHRVTAGDAPACVQACPTQAMAFGDLEELISRGDARPLRDEPRVDPAVVYVGLRQADRS